MYYSNELTFIIWWSKGWFFGVLDTLIFLAFPMALELMSELLNVKILDSHVFVVVFTVWPES